MIDEETIKKLNEWIEDKERCFDTSHTDGQYSISQLELDAITRAVQGRK